MGTGSATNEDVSLYGLSVQVAGLTGRIDQVLIDHHQAILRNQQDIATEKRERTEDVKTLGEKLETHSLRSENERATLAANVKDLQADSSEYRSRLDAVGPRAWVALGVLISLGSLIYSIYGHH